MLHHIMNEYEQVNCVTKKKSKEKRDEGKRVTVRIPDK